LFIRRHNDFAAPPATGLESLLELGVNVNGTQVRFDAIEPFASDSVPGPSLGSGLALRYGVTEIPWTQKRDPRATHYLEVALRSTSRPDSSDEAQSLAANFVFVIDTSGSMEGAKISGVLAGMRALFAAMRPQDTIGIIDFDVQARTVLPATQVSELTPAAFNTALGRLVAAGGTDLYLGLEAGIAEAANNADTAAISYVFLFSDGNPTDGITEWLQIRAAMVEAVRGTPIRISTFGFGADANGRELDALAGVTGGAYTPVSDPASLGANLAEDLGRREILVAKDIRLKLEIDPTVSLIHLYGHDQVAEPIARAAVDSGAEAGSAPSASIGTEEEGLQITVPDLAAGEAYWVVLEVAVPEALLAELGTAAVTYVDTATGEHVEDGLVLTLEDRPTSLRRHVIIQHAVGLWSSDVAFYTLDDLAQDDRETASARLAAHAASLAAAHDEWQRSWLDDDTVTMRRLSLLAESLATGRLGARAASDTLALLRYTLETFGRARSGFVPLAVGLVP
jgi:Mg-chelatase subunit ChlD